LDDEAAVVFDTWATDHIGDRFAIVLDDHVISAPVLRTGQFRGRAQISGTFDLEQTRELVAILQGGALPVAAEVLDVCPAAGDCPGASPLPSLVTGS
ncbi:MAG: protein translocase subunit SecD, partial [Chloroflexi bacterium]|nr:protein translocase subunit SecD [Chloroflexota bacterium]